MATYFKIICNCKEISCWFLYSYSVFQLKIYDFWIFTGKILDDVKKISEYKIEERNFVVIMVAKVIFAKLYLKSSFDLKS